MSHGRRHQQSEHVSANADNRKFCVEIQREKFCYESYKKAERACEFLESRQRIYYCKSCCAYHTTSFLSKKKYLSTAQAENSRRIAKLLDKRLGKKVNDLSDFNDPTLRRIIKKHYHPVIEEYLIEHFSTKRSTTSLSEGEIEAQLKDAVKFQENEYIAEALNETLNYPFFTFKGALVFMILFYMDLVKGLYASDTDKMMEIFVDLDKISGKARKGVNEILAQLYKDKKITVSEFDEDDLKRFVLSAHV